MEFIVASIIKVPMNMFMYNMIQDKKIKINVKLKYQEGDFEDGAGML